MLQIQNTIARHQPQAPPRNALMPRASGCRCRARQSFPERRGAASWKLRRCVVAVAQVAAACCMWAAGKKARARSRQAKPTRQRSKHTPHAAANTAAQPSSPPDTSGFRARGRSPISSIDVRPPRCLSPCPAPPTPACSSRDIRSKCSPPAFEHSRETATDSPPATTQRTALSCVTSMPAAPSHRRCRPRWAPTAATRS